MLVEYIWLDKNNTPRSKTKIIYEKMTDSVKLPVWNYDGSSTGQAEGFHSEIMLKPQTLFKDPFRGGDSIMVVCDTYNPDMTPHVTNTRIECERKMNKNKSLEPIFGIEQEFFLEKNGVLLGWVPQEENKNTFLYTPKEQSDYYCGVGTNNAIGRDCVENAFKRCLLAGIRLTGMNAEVAPAQWEFQVCETGVVAADHLVAMRYVLARTAEMHKLTVNLHPKPMSEGDWNGSGCHVNFSTEPMRNKNGYDEIIKAVQKLEKKHDYHMLHYGKDNSMRMTGQHETASYGKFNYGVGSRNTSIRIPNTVFENKCGYFEDRRPASNMDPYVVLGLLFDTCCL